MIFDSETIISCLLHAVYEDDFNNKLLPQLEEFFYSKPSISFMPVSIAAIASRLVSAPTFFQSFFTETALHCLSLA